MTLGPRLVVALAAAVWAGAALAAQGQDPFIGTWKLSVEKSRYEVGQPPRSWTRTYEDRGGGVLFLTIEGESTQGNRTFAQVVYKRDAKNYPEATIGAKSIRLVSVRAVDVYSEEVSFVSSGRASELRTTFVVSRDGRTLTQRLFGMNAQGQSFTNMVVFDKQ